MATWSGKHSGVMIAMCRRILVSVKKGEQGPTEHHQISVSQTVQCSGLLSDAVHGNRPSAPPNV